MRMMAVKDRNVLVVGRGSQQGLLCLHWKKCKNYIIKSFIILSNVGKKIKHLSLKMERLTKFKSNTHPSSSIFFRCTYFSLQLTKAMKSSKSTFYGGLASPLLTKVLYALASLQVRTGIFLSYLAFVVVVVAESIVQLRRFGEETIMDCIAHCAHV